MAAKQIFQLLGNSQISLAKDCLFQWRKDVPEDRFDQTHAEAKILLYEADYINSLGIFENLLKIAPNRLDIHADLCLCFYQLGLHDSLQKQLGLIKPLLDKLSLGEVNELIFFSKLFEEFGDTDQSLLLLDQAMSLCNSKKQIQSIEIQKLRLLIELGELDKAGNLYSNITEGTAHNLNFEFEREHALFLADFHFFGIHAAIDRFRYLSEQKLCQSDLSFFQSELIEMMIESRKFEFIDVINLKDFNQSEYETQQLKMLGSWIKNEAPSISINRLEKTLTRVSLIRLLHQGLLLFPDLRNDAVYLGKLKLHIQGLPSSRLKAKWTEKIFNYSQNSNYTVSQSEFKISTDHQSWIIKNNIFWILIGLFKDTNQASIELAIQAVYNQSLSVSNFDRLRMMISRLNQKLHAQGLPVFFKITKSHVHLCVEIKYDK